MRTCVQKWGHGFALRIPRSLAIEVGLNQDAEVDVVLIDGKLIVTPLHTMPFTLEDLLAGIMLDNLHGENDTGMPVGNEVR